MTNVHVWVIFLLVFFLFCFLQDDAAAGFWVVLGTDFIFISVNIEDMNLIFPLVVHLGDGDQLNSLPLEDTYFKFFQRKMKQKALQNTQITTKKKIQKT